MPHSEHRQANNDNPQTRLSTSRRGFLQLSLASSISLSLASGLVSTLAPALVPVKAVASENSSTEKLEYRFLTPSSAEFLAALFPVVLAKTSLNQDENNALLMALDKMIFHFSAFNQKQMQQLFDVMAYAPIRFVAGAPWANWPEASHEDIQSFLVGWRDSRFELKRMGYLSVCKLINLCWYARKESFAQTGYPGPPVKIPTPVSNSL
ncbi:MULTISPECIES: hypothetical protein [unclassified Marinomonas]|uniref:hypothetical protein n=1 Tax=unclassified Marinomonas TaxID=196814 RepID=UPI0007AF0EAE|nr:MULTISPECIES: hypothetical protein [unclassified Marinomonas]